MADSTAQFQEVLALKVDLELFKQQMSQVADIYKESLKGVANQGIGTSDIVKGIQDLQATIERLGSSGGKVLNNLTQTMIDTAGTIEKGVAGINAGLETLGKNTGPEKTSTGILSANTSFEKLIQSFGNIPNMIGNVLALNLAWKIAGEVINLAGEAIAAPFKAIQEGVQYIRQLETATADIQGVLAANITLSKDLPTNFKLAGDAAEIVRKKLEDIALATGLTTQGLQSAFKQLVEAGGGAFVTDINQLVQLTELFGLSMKAAGKDVNATRTLLSELPALLSGSEAPTSKLLEVLHLTKAEWEQIRISALAHHDLLSQLAPILQPYTDVVANAGTRQQVLLDQLGLIKDRIEAAFSKDVFEGYTAALLSIKAYLADNEATVTSIGRVFADLVISVTQVAAGIAKAFGGDTVKVFGQVINVIDALINNAVTHVVAMTQVLIALGKAAFGVATGDFASIGEQALRIKEALSQAGAKFADDLDRAAATAADIDQNTTKFRDAFDAKIKSRGLVPAEAQGDVAQTPLGTFVGTGTAPTVPFADNSQLLKALSTQLPILNSTQPRVPPQKSETLQLLREELTARIDAVKEEGQTELDYINRLEHLKDISSEQAAEFRVARFKQTFKDISQAADDLLAKAQNDGLTKPQLDSFTSTVNKIKSSASRTEGKDVTAVQDANDTKQFKTVDESLTREQKAYDDHQRALLALDHELLQEKILTNSQVAQSAIDTENRIYQNDRDVFEKKFANAKQDADLQRKLSEDIDNLDKAHTDRLIRDSENLKAARIKDRQEEFAVEDKARQVNISRLQEQLSAGQASGSLSRSQENTLQVDIGQSKLDDANAKAAEATLTYVQAVVAANAAGKANTLSVQQAKIALDAMKVSAQAAADNLAHIQAQGTVEGQVSQTLFKTDSFKDAFSSIQNTGDSLKSAVGFVGNTIGQIQQGFKQGGTLGGIGAILQNPLVGAIPVAGPFIQAAGAVMSLIGGLFTAQAQHIADDIKKNVDKTLKDINNGTDTAAVGLAALEQQRQDAVSRLSGVKGGKSQLDKILPGIDDAIAQLKKQIADVKQNFEDALAVLQNSSNSDGGVMAKWLQDWQAINKQVKDYLDAVGSAGNANAQAFLNLQLANERAGLQTQYNQGEQQAISDALSLNDLLTQRNNLEISYAQTKFGLLSADDVERRGTGAILAGQQLAKAALDQSTQLNTLDYQIAQTTQKLSIEKTVFSIASDTATLQSESLALQLTDLATLKQQYLDIQSILANTANLIAGPNGAFFGTPLLPGVAPIPGFGGTNAPPITINISGVQDGKQFATDLYNELNNRYQTGQYAFSSP